MAVLGLLGRILARGSLRRGRLAVTGCSGLGHDLLGKGGFSELSPRVGSLNGKESVGSKQRGVVVKKAAVVLGWGRAEKMRFYEKSEAEFRRGTDLDGGKR